MEWDDGGRGRSLDEDGEDEDEDEEEEEEEGAGPDMGMHIGGVNVSGSSGIHVGNKVSLHQYFIVADPVNLDLLKLNDMENTPLMIKNGTDFQETLPPINSLSGILGLTQENACTHEGIDGREAISGCWKGTFSGGQGPVISLPLDDEHCHSPNISEEHSENQPKESTVDVTQDEENDEGNPSTTLSVALLSSGTDNTNEDGVISSSKKIDQDWWSGMLLGPSSRETIVFNEFLDHLLQSIKEEMLKEGETTAELPNLNCPIRVSLWHPIVLKGLFTTECGSLGDLSTLYRSDDVIVSVDGESLSLGVHMGVEKIEASAKYKLHFANNYSEGLLSVTCSCCRVSAIVSAGKRSFDKFRLLHFCIEEMGELIVKTEGQGMLNKVAGPTITVIWNQFRDLIKYGLSKGLKKALKKAIRKLDKTTLKIEYNPEEQSDSDSDS